MSALFESAVIVTTEPHENFNKTFRSVCTSHFTRDTKLCHLRACFRSQKCGSWRDPCQRTSHCSGTMTQLTAATCQQCSVEWNRRATKASVELYTTEMMKNPLTVQVKTYLYCSTILHFLGLLCSLSRLQMMHTRPWTENHNTFSSETHPHASTKQKSNSTETEDRKLMVRDRRRTIQENHSHLEKTKCNQLKPWSRIAAMSLCKLAKRDARTVTTVRCPDLKQTSCASVPQTDFTTSAGTRSVTPVKA